MRFLPILILLIASEFAFAQSLPPASYYNSAIGKTGTLLKSVLHERIKGHTVLPYTAASTDTWDALKVLDEDSATAANVLLIYSGYSVAKAEQWTGSSGIWDREHLWPQSYGLVALSASGRARTDVFNLRPCDVSVNSSRGNKYYDETTPPGTSYPDAPLSSYDSDSWEPREQEKGAIARSLFYMAVRYDGSDADAPDLELSEAPNAALYRFGKLTTFLVWNRQHPPTDTERERSQLIFDNYQHNRNPFIDHADFADMVFLSATPAQAWKNLRFTSQELINPAISGDVADADQDGFANLLEYTFQSDPRAPNSAALITASVSTVGNVRYMYLTFPHNRNATDIAISYEGSENCVAWNQVSAEPVATMIADFETEQVTVRIPTTTLRFFVRARIWRLP